MGIRHRILISLLLTAALSLLMPLLRDEMETDTIRKNRYWVAKTHRTGSYPILFAGDSRVFRGISPKAFTGDREDLPAYNYAYWSNGMGKLYLDGLEEKLEAVNGFGMIVMGITPHSLTPRAAACYHYAVEKGRTREQVFQQLYLSRIQEFFVPFKVRDVRRKLAGKPASSNLRTIYHEDGWVESWWLEPDTAYSDQFYQEIFTDNRVSEEVVEGFLSRVSAWTGKGVHVVGFRPPTAHSIRRLEHEKGGFDEEDFVERFVQAGGIWVDVDPYVYATYDGNHVEHESARVLSADLARAVRDLLPTP